MALQSFPPDCSANYCRLKEILSSVSFVHVCVGVYVHLILSNSAFLLLGFLMTSPASLALRSHSSSTTVTSTCLPAFTLVSLHISQASDISPSSSCSLSSSFAKYLVLLPSPLTHHTTTQTLEHSL